MHSEVRTVFSMDICTLKPKKSSNVLQLNLHHFLIIKNLERDYNEIIINNHKYNNEKNVRNKCFFQSQTINYKLK